VARRGQEKEGGRIQYFTPAKTRVQIFTVKIAKLPGLSAFETVPQLEPDLKIPAFYRGVG